MKRRTWLIVAALLLAAAALLMRHAEEPRPARAGAAAEVTFPRKLDKPQVQRMRARQTLPAIPQEPSRPRDPLLAAIASGATSAVVVEANALRHSPVGELVIACILARGAKNPISELRERVGVDVLADLDRVAVTENGVVLSGRFERARWGELIGSRPSGSVVSWGDQLLIVARDEAQARAALDRLEGRAATAPVISEEMTYGEIYGVLAAEDVAKLLPPDQTELAGRLRGAAERIELHVDASHDVGIVADVVGPDAARVEDLGKTLGGLLAAARVRSLADGDPELAELLELARVVQRDGAFVLELGLPLELLQARLSGCVAERRNIQP